MPTVRIAPDARQQFFDNQGNVLNGGKLFTYLAGSSTKEPTYTSSTGASQNTNPIVLNSSGRSPSGIWLTEGVEYKFVLAPANDTDPPASPIWSEDHIVGVNDESELDSFIADLANSSNGAKGSALVGFFPSGTGAVGRTVQSKLRDIVSITDFMTTNELADYIAGSHALDLSTAIQAALDSTADGIYFPDGSGKISVGLTAQSDTYLWGPGEIFWTGTFDAITITGKTHVTVDGLRFQGNATYYAVRAKTKAQFITVVNCHAEETNLFATNDISDSYAGQSESTYCNNFIIANNTGNIATPVADTGFIVIAYARDGTIVGNTSVGAYYGIFTWGGNITTQDAITNARKCIRISIVGNNVAPTTAGIFFLVSDSCVSDGNTVSGCSGDVGIDMESCLACTHQNNRVKVAKQGLYLYGLNRDCLFANNDIETTGSSAVMIGTNIAGPVVSPYAGMGTVAFRGNTFKRTDKFTTADFGLNNHLILEGNIFENVVIISSQNAGNTAANILELRGNTFLMDFTPTPACVVEMGAGLTGFTLQSLTPTYIIENNKVINRTGVVIAKVAYSIEAFLNAGKIILKNNHDEKWGTSILVDTNVGTVTREVRIEGQTTNATTPLNWADTTYATVLYDKWITPAFAAGNFTAGGAQTWTVASGDVTTYAYKIEGKSMTVNFFIVSSSVGGTPDPLLKIAIPGGRTATKRARVACYINDNGTDRASVCEVAAAGQTINISASVAGANWAAAADTTFAAGSITFEID